MLGRQFGLAYRMWFCLYLKCQHAMTLHFSTIKSAALMIIHSLYNTREVKARHLRFHVCDSCPTLHSSILPYPALYSPSWWHQRRQDRILRWVFLENDMGGKKLNTSSTFLMTDTRCRALSQVVCKTALHALSRVACPSFDISHLFTFVTVMQNMWTGVL